MPPVTIFLSKSSAFPACDQFLKRGDDHFNCFRKLKYNFPDKRLARYLLIAPTGLAIDMSLSFKPLLDLISRHQRCSSPRMPYRTHAPSPITATTLLLLFDSFFATDIPSVDEIDVELCAAPNGSYSLSDLFVKPDNPPPFLRVLILSSSSNNFMRITLVAYIPN